MRIGVVIFQPYGDHMLRAPFLSELYRLCPDASVTVITDDRGLSVYPLLDSRLEIVRLKWRRFSMSNLAKARSLGRFDLLFVLDQGRFSIVTSMFVRAARRIGWTQSVSTLYFGPSVGFRERLILPTFLSALLTLFWRSPGVRRPDGDYEGHVELKLLAYAAKENPQVLDALSAYRTTYSRPAAPKATPRVLFLSTTASWITKQLETAQWLAIVDDLSTAFPDYKLIVYCTDDVAAYLPWSDSVQRFVRSDDLARIFDLVSSAELVICSDSFVCHLASWSEVPALVMFGTAVPLRFRPTSAYSEVIYHKPPCSPCVRQPNSQPCVAGYRQCLSLQQVTADEVCSAAKRILAKQPGVPD